MFVIPGLCGCGPSDGVRPTPLYSKDSSARISRATPTAGAHDAIVHRASHNNTGCPHGSSAKERASCSKISTKAGFPDEHSPLGQQQEPWRDRRPSAVGVPGVDEADPGIREIADVTGGQRCAVHAADGGDLSIRRANGLPLFLSADDDGSVLLSGQAVERLQAA